MDEQNTKLIDEPTEQQSAAALPPTQNDFMADPAILSYIEQQIQTGIQKALQGNTPKANTVDFTEQERKNFEKMTYKERLKLFNTNPNAYNKLAKGSM